MSDFKAHIVGQLDLSKAKSEMNQFLNDYKNNNVEIDVKLGKISTDKIESQLKSVKIKPVVNDSEIKEAVKSVDNLANKQKQLNNFKMKLNTQGVAADLSKLESQINKFQKQTLNPEQNSVFKSINSSYNELNKMMSDLETKSKNNILNTSDIDQFNTKLKTTQNQLRILSNDLSGMTTASERIKLTTEMESWLKSNTKATKEAKAAIKSYIDEVNRAGKDLTKGEYNDISKQFKNTTAEMKAQGKVGKSVINEVGRGIRQIGQFAGTYGLIQNAVDSVVKSITELKEIDTILTEISKTSDLTSSQLKELGKNSFKEASVYGKTASEYLLGVQEMSRSGFYGKQAEDLAKLSILGQAAGDMSADISNSYLLATNAAYEYQGSAEKLNAVLDGQNMITNRNSVAMQDMASATTQAGSMAAQSGVQIDQLSALIGTAVARTKKSGDEIGTALKALFINLQNTQNKKIVGTFDDLDISMTKMVGDSEMLKTPIELIKELSEVYNTLPDGSKQKADILTNIGGKHHANVLSSILAGYSDYEKMLVDYSQGAGSAAVEAEKSANNWEGSLAKLSNSWTSFIGNFANTDLIIGATNALTGFLDVLNSMTSNPLLAAGSVAGGIGAFKLFKNLDKLKNHRVSLLFSYT